MLCYKYTKQKAFTIVGIHGSLESSDITILRCERLKIHHVWGSPPTSPLLILSNGQTCTESPLAPCSPLQNYRAGPWGWSSTRKEAPRAERKNQALTGSSPISPHRSWWREEGRADGCPVGAKSLLNNALTSFRASFLLLFLGKQNSKVYKAKLVLFKKSYHDALYIAFNILNRLRGLFYLWNE